MEGIAKLGDRPLASLIGAILFVIGGWPLLLLQMPPYQDLPDHLATVCVLLDPARYPEFLPNGWFKANSLFIGLLYQGSKWLGLLTAGRIVSAAVIAATAWTLPHFVLAFTDRRRLLVASLVMAPMVHHWFILMGMLGFALALPLGLCMLVLLARQAAQPSVPRAALLAGLAALLWWSHAVVLIFVVLLAAVEVLVRPNSRAKASTATALLVPLAPAVLLLFLTVARQAAETRGGPNWGRLDEISYASNGSALYALWAHEFFGLSPLSAAGLVPALALAFMAARSARAQVTLLSSWAGLALGAVYAFSPHTLPAFGFVNERAIPFLWAWALVRVPSQVPRWVATLLLLGSTGWAVGLAADLFRAEADLQDFVSAAPDVPVGAHLLTLNFAPRLSSRNTSSLLHASGMYTVLRQAEPQDLWADSPAMPLVRTRPPSFVEDPVAIRNFLFAAGTPDSYCEALSRGGLQDLNCRHGWLKQWSEFWQEAQSRYDYVLLWGTPAEVFSTVPASYSALVSRGRLTLLARTAFQ